MAVLKPAPVDIKQFMYDKLSRTFSVDASCTQGFGRVYDDSVDEGLTVVNHETGAEVVFVLQFERRDREGDLTHWELRSVSRPGYFMTVWND